MENNSNAGVYNISMEGGEELGVKPEFLVSAYNAIYFEATKAAPAGIRKELLITQDGRTKSTFHVKVSGKMAPYLIKSIQDQTKPGYGVALTAYFHKLQEQIMAQMFSNVGEMTFPKFS